MSDSPPLSPALVFFFSVSFRLYVFPYLPGGTSGKKINKKQKNPLASAGDMRLGFNPGIEIEEIRDEPRGWGHRPNAPDSPVRS